MAKTNDQYRILTPDEITRARQIIKEAVQEAKQVRLQSGTGLKIHGKIKHSKVKFTKK